MRHLLHWVCLVFVIGLIIGCEPNIPKATSDPQPGAATGGTSSATTGDAPPSAAMSGSLKRIIILTNGNSPYWDACRSGLLDANRELKLAEQGLEAIFEVNDGTPQGQIDKLKQYGSQADVVAIGISPVDADNVAIADELRALQKQGIKIAAIDSDLNRERLRDARYAFLGTDNLVGGQVLGQCAAVLRPQGGEYVTFVGRTGAQNAKERIGGFAVGAGEKFVSKDSMGDDLDPSRARENVRNAVRNHPNLGVLVGIWSYNAPAIVDVCKEANLRSDPAKKVTVVTFDAEPQAIVEMQAGNIDAMVVQDPYAMGYQGVRLLAALVKEDKDILKEMYPNYGQTDGDLYDTGLKVVVPNADSPLKAENFSGNVKFLVLSEFQSWLEKYGLPGS